MKDVLNKFNRLKDYDEVASYDDVVKIANINGVKSIDFFPIYALPLEKQFSTGLEYILNTDAYDSEVTIGIIDGGISDNALLKPYIINRERRDTLDKQRNDRAGASEKLQL